MSSDNFVPRLNATERARLHTEARAEAARLREQAIHDTWSAIFGLARSIIATVQRRWRAPSP